MVTEEGNPKQRQGMWLQLQALPSMSHDHLPSSALSAYISNLVSTRRYLGSRVLGGCGGVATLKQRLTVTPVARCKLDDGVRADHRHILEVTSLNE